MGNMENPTAASRRCWTPRAAPRSHEPSTRSAGVRVWFATRVGFFFMCVVSVLFATGMSLLVAYIVMSAASAMAKREVTPTTPSVLIHGYPIPIVANQTVNRTSFIRARNIKMQGEEKAEVEQLDAAESAVVSVEATTTDLDLELEAGSVEAGGSKAVAAAAAAAAPELRTMASLTVVEVYEPQTKTATISYWPDLVEPTSVVLQTPEPSSFTIKLRPGTGNMQPWWHRPQITRNLPKPEVTSKASATGTREFGAKQTTPSSPLSSPTSASVRSDVWGTPVASFTAVTQSAEAKASAAANRKHLRMTSVFYSVLRPGHGHHVTAELPTVVPTAKNITVGSGEGSKNMTDGSAAIPASAAAPAGARVGDHSSLDKSAAAGFKNENTTATTTTTTSPHDDGDERPHVRGRPAMVLTNGTVVMPPPRPANMTTGAAAVFKRHLGPAAAAAAAARLNVSAAGLVATNGTRVLWANGTASAAARAAQMSGELTARVAV